MTSASSTERAVRREHVGALVLVAVTSSVLGRQWFSRASVFHAPSPPLPGSSALGVLVKQDHPRYIPRLAW